MRQCLQSGKETNAVRRVYVYGVLWNLCIEHSSLASDPAFAKRCKGLDPFFTARLEQAVGELNLTMPATAEAASALTMAADIAFKLCKPYLALSLSSNAASMVISLGYHRLSTMQSDTEHEQQSKILLFWMAYWFDTSFSVCLGRAPVIRHSEIAVPRLSHGSIVPSIFVDAFNYCTSVGTLQCQTVEQLYSPLSLQQSADERSKRASRLVAELCEAWDGREEASSCVADDVKRNGFYLLLRESDAVIHYSTLTLVQHAMIPVAKGESPAIGSARKALRLNVNAWNAYKHLPDAIWSGHCHWTLLKGPITPFIVTFCHIIAHPSTAKADLCLLADYVATLKDLRRFSDGMVKLCRLCDVFCKVATLYVQAKDTEAGQWVDLQNAADQAPNPIGQPAVNDTDEYLSAMGFSPPPASPNGNSHMFGSDAAFDATFLYDWHQGNSSLMGFLELDLTFPGEPDNGCTPDTSEHRSDSEVHNGLFHNLT